MVLANRINPKVRAYGKARLDITLRAKSEQEWLQGWHAPLFEFPFHLDQGWRSGFEYKVDDFAAEIGFFLDQLGFPVTSFSPSYARFTTPQEDFILCIAQALEGETSTPPESLRLHFQVLDLEETVEELETRGIDFEQLPRYVSSNSANVATFRSPHGISIDLWEQVEDYVQEQPEEILEDPDENDFYLQSQTADDFVDEEQDLEIQVEAEPEIFEDPVEESFERSKRKNYRLWDENDEDAGEAYDQDADEEPLVQTASGNRDAFLDHLLKETSDRQVETDADEDETGEDRTSPVDQASRRIAGTRSVLRELRQQQRSRSNSASRSLSSFPAFSRRASMTYVEQETESGEQDDPLDDEPVYQEIDQGDVDYLD